VTRAGHQHRRAGTVLGVVGSAECRNCCSVAPEDNSTADLAAVSYSIRQRLRSRRLMSSRVRTREDISLGQGAGAVRPRLAPDEYPGDVGGKPALPLPVRRGGPGGIEGDVPRRRCPLTLLGGELVGEAARYPEMTRRRTRLRSRGGSGYEYGK
jgi:hypothetical protein